MSAAQTDIVVRLATHALSAGPEDIIGTERIKHGLTNESWLVRTSGDAVVVRISNTAEEELQIDRRSEAAILTAVSAAGIGAEVLLCDPVRHVLVTRYLGPTWSEDASTLDANIDRLGSLLRRLHAVAAPAGVRSVHLGSTIEGYLSTLDQHGFRGNLTEQSLRESARQIAQRLGESARPVLCHNDVHYLNLVDGGSGLRLIDWEYAGIGESLFDLASACVYHRYDRRQRERLLAAYRSQPDETILDLSVGRLELACWLFEYIRDLWLAVRNTVEDERVEWRAST